MTVELSLPGVMEGALDELFDGELLMVRFPRNRLDRLLGVRTRISERHQRDKRFGAGSELRARGDGPRVGGIGSSELVPQLEDYPFRCLYSDPCDGGLISSIDHGDADIHM